MYRPCTFREGDRHIGRGVCHVGDASEHAQMQLVALCDPVEGILFMLALSLSVGFYRILQCLHTVILGQWVTTSHIIRS